MTTRTSNARLEAILAPMGMAFFWLRSTVVVTRDNATADGGDPALMVARYDETTFWGFERDFSTATAAAAWAEALTPEALEAEILAFQGLA